MHAYKKVICVLGLTAAAALVFSSAAEARCRTFEASHNGTDLFNPEGGAKGTARNKMMWAIEKWKKEKGIKKVRIGKIRYRCDPWTGSVIIIPHHRCYAKARVCG